VFVRRPGAGAAASGQSGNALLGLGGPLAYYDRQQRDVPTPDDAQINTEAIQFLRWPIVESMRLIFRKRKTEVGKDTECSRHSPPPRP
jgi:hypothetical protein